MKLKLDENIDVRLTTLLAQHGHEADTVLQEGLSGSTDETIYRICLKEGRTLITLDLDFSNPLRFPPNNTEGIIVLRPSRPLLSAIHAMLFTLLPQFHQESVRNKLWIVEPGRIRIYNPLDS